MPLRRELLRLRYDGKLVRHLPHLPHCDAFGFADLSQFLSETRLHLEPAHIRLGLGTGLPEPIKAQRPEHEKLDTAPYAYSWANTCLVVS
jgi:hypothetical protein